MTWRLDECDIEDGEGRYADFFAGFHDPETEIQRAERHARNDLWSPTGEW